MSLQPSPGFAGAVSPGCDELVALGLQVELQVLDVGEADFLQTSGAAAAVLEVDLLGSFGGDLLRELVVVPACWASKRRAAYCGGRATVRFRIRSSSVEPIGAV